MCFFPIKATDSRLQSSTKSLPIEIKIRLDKRRPRTDEELCSRYSFHFLKGFRGFEGPLGFVKRRLYTLFHCSPPTLVYSCMKIPQLWSTRNFLKYVFHPSAHPGLDRSCVPNLRGRWVIVSRENLQKGLERRGRRWGRGEGHGANHTSSFCILKGKGEKKSTIKHVVHYYLFIGRYFANSILQMFYIYFQF